ncbi:MAG TPA: hypothetical protein VHN37_09940 [Actinomycetota bacterium]|nr:hypothetical protein [Actinomycetota bacterium]
MGPGGGSPKRAAALVAALAVGLGGCESGGDTGEAAGTPSPEAATSAPATQAPATSTNAAAAREQLDGLFEGVRGYSFTDARPATRRGVLRIIERHLSVPPADVVVKAVARKGRRVPVMVLAAAFDLPRPRLKKVLDELFQAIRQAFDSAEPVLDGLAIRFIGSGGEAVAYIGPRGELVYVLALEPNLALPVAEALIGAE